MRVLLLTTSFNSLAQRMFVALSADGHEVSVEFDINDTVTAEAVALFRPDVLVAPFLKRAIPAAIYSALPCLIVHPGPPGDRGPSALDWAIMDEAATWGVTVIEAEAEMDAGPVWASAHFPMRAATKSSLYRREVTDAAVMAVRQALARLSAGGYLAEPVPGIARPAMRQADRAINWAADKTDAVLRKIRAADGAPGVRAAIAGKTVYLHDAHPADGLSGAPGSLVARSGPALAIATHDGAVWIGRMRVASGIKLPATTILAEAAAQLPEIAIDTIAIDTPGGYSEITYKEHGAVGALHFAFHNGAMGTAACARLLAAYRAACARPTAVLVLAGGPDFWSNGMDLNAIEASPSPADASLANINAIDDVAEAIISTTDKLIIASLEGNAGAGGVFLARAADEVWLASGVILNPHYKDMGNLYGSEYWTYVGPRACGAEAMARITNARLPMGEAEALDLGLVNAVLPRTGFTDAVIARAQALAAHPDFSARLTAKAKDRARDEAIKPLAAYRAQELAHMHRNFYGFDPSYHVARAKFVRKEPKSRTPVTIARHRDRRLARSSGRAP